MSSAAPPKKRTPAQIIAALKLLHIKRPNSFYGDKCYCCGEFWPCDTIRVINGEPLS